MVVETSSGVSHATAVDSSEVRSCPASGWAAKDQGDNAPGHVLVDTSEPLDRDPDTGLLLHLAPPHVLDDPTEFKRAPPEAPRCRCQRA